MLETSAIITLISGSSGLSTLLSSEGFPLLALAPWDFLHDVLRTSNSPPCYAAVSRGDSGASPTYHMVVLGALGSPATNSKKLPRGPPEWARRLASCTGGSLSAGRPITSANAIC